MPRKSTIDRLPSEVRETIGRLRRDKGYTIDEILNHLRQLDVDIARSTLARHTKTIDEVADEMRRQYMLAEVIADRFGDKPDDVVARSTVTMAQALLSRLTSAKLGEPVNLESKEAMFLMTAVEKVAKAAKLTDDRILKLREEVAKELADRLDQAAQDAVAAGEKGLSAERVAQLRRDFLGVREKKS